MSQSPSEQSQRRPAAPSDAPVQQAGSAVHFLLTTAADSRRESRRILAGFAALLVLAVVAFNVVLYRDASNRLEREGWTRLSATADQRRDEVMHWIETFEREAQSLASDPEVVAVVHSYLHADVVPIERSQIVAELEDGMRLFGFENVQVLGPNGEVLEELSPTLDPERRAAWRTARKALEAGQPNLGDPYGDEVMYATVVADAHCDRPVVLVFHTMSDQVFTPLLTKAPGLGASAGSYVVRRDGKNSAILTDLSDRNGMRAGMRIPMDAPPAMAAAMAASGVESRAEVLNARGEPAWAVTRSLGDSGWGIVTQVDRADMMAGLGMAVQGLMLLDLALAVAVIAMAWIWLRLYTSGLAKREIEITEKHAQRVQAVFDTAFDAIFTFDRRGRVRTVNRAAETLFGRPGEEMDGQPVQRFLHWGERGALLPLPGAVGTGEALQADGERVAVEFSLGSAGDGDDLLYTAIVRDITQRVDSENRIRAFAEGLEVSNRRLEEANAQLEAASRLKSEFLANTSHELRTPLNGMIGFLQLVLDGMCDSPEEERDFLKQALQCSRHLLGLINDVLDIAKIESGKLMLEIDPIDVQTLFDEVYTVTHVQAAQRGIELRFEADIAGSARARGDFGKVKQVLINLVGNSLKFTPKGSIIVRGKAHPELGHLMFEVNDTGIGIPPDRQKVIFEKFVQADGSTTRRFGGTGLGLAISRSLVELMGGIIGVHSDGEGKGTRMYFSLPMWRDEALPAPEPLAANERIEGPGGGALVLVVEDDPVFRRFITAVLQQSGYRTVEADQAEAGWMLARRLRPAVVVLDYALSCGDNATLRTGWDLAERMTTEPETRHMPLVFVTGFDGELRQKLKSTAFSRRPEHLVKPIEANVLIAKIHELAGDAGSRQLRILMADDDPTVAAYVRKVLPADRFHVEVANNGEECLHILRTQPNGFDVLLLDLMMPQVSGYDVLREMTLTGIRADLPVLVLTNFPEARNEEERRLLEQGMVLDVVSKSAVHDNPQLLPYVLDWHLQAAADKASDDQREAA